MKLCKRNILDKKNKFSSDINEYQLDFPHRQSFEAAIKKELGKSTLPLICSGIKNVIHFKRTTL